MAKTIAKLLIFIFIGFLLAGLVGTILADQADASITKVKPHRSDVVVDHCISHKEFINAERTDKTRFERTNGVYGDGKIVVWQNGGDHRVYQYPWCGLTQDQGFMQVSYDRNKAGYLMANFITEYDFR